MVHHYDRRGVHKTGYIMYPAKRFTLNHVKKAIKRFPLCPFWHVKKKQRTFHYIIYLKIMNEFEVKIPNSLKIKMIIMMMITVKALRVKSLWIRKFVRTNTSKLGDQYCKTFFPYSQHEQIWQCWKLGTNLGQNNLPC